jgi:hypothetical protein
MILYTPAALEVVVGVKLVSRAFGAAMTFPGPFTIHLWLRAPTPFSVMTAVMLTGSILIFITADEELIVMLAESAGQTATISIESVVTEQPSKTDKATAYVPGTVGLKYAEFPA